MMLIEQSLLDSAVHRLKKRLEVRIDNERSCVRVAELSEFDMSLLSIWSWKHMHDGHEVLAGA